MMQPAAGVAVTESLRSRVAWAAIAGFLVAAAACWGASPPLPDAADYAFGFPVVADDPAADLYRAPVPLTLYRSVTDPALRDCGVYNAAGKAVPRVFEAPSRREPDPPVRRSAPWFGLTRGESQAADRLRLRIEHHATTLEVDSPAAAPGPPDGDLAAYIVDTREIERPVVAVHLEWPDLEENFIGRIEVDRSDDLDRWTPAGAATIADLRRDEVGPDGGGRIERRSVALRPASARYLRLRWSELPGGWSLSGLAVELAGRAPQVEVSWLELPADSAEPTDDGVVFDLGGSPWVERIVLDLPSDNTVVRARISAWSEETGSWRRVHQGRFYHLRRGGNSVSSEAVDIDLQRMRRLRVEVIQGRLEGPWSLRVGWRPDRLVFVAQGAGPYQVACGRAADRADGFPQARILGDVGILDLVDRESYGPARLGERVDLAGAAGLTAAAPTASWRRLLLWAVLIVGVLVVGLMAWWLLQERRAAD